MDAASWRAKFHDLVSNFRIDLIKSLKEIDDNGIRSQGSEWNGSVSSELQSDATSPLPPVSLEKISQVLDLLMEVQLDLFMKPNGATKASTGPREPRVENSPSGLPLVYTRASSQLSFGRCDVYLNQVPKKNTTLPTTEVCVDPPPSYGKWYTKGYGPFRGVGSGWSFRTVKRQQYSEKSSDDEDSSSSSIEVRSRKRKRKLRLHKRQVDHSNTNASSTSYRITDDSDPHNHSEPPVIVECSLDGVLSSSPSPTQSAVTPVRPVSPEPSSLLRVLEDLQEQYGRKGRLSKLSLKSTAHKSHHLSVPLHGNEGKPSRSRSLSPSLLVSPAPTPASSRASSTPKPPSSAVKTCSVAVTRLSLKGREAELTQLMRSGPYLDKGNSTHGPYSDKGTSSTHSPYLGVSHVSDMTVDKNARIGHSLSATEISDRFREGSLHGSDDQPFSSDLQKAKKRSHSLSLAKPSNPKVRLEELLPTGEGSLVCPPPKVIECTACRTGIHWSNRPIHDHQRLHVLICQRCWRRYKKGTFSVVNGNEIYCTLCGDGGQLVCCDTCIQSFCCSCIERILGKHSLAGILKEDNQSKWSCFSCDKRPIQPFQEIRDSLYSYFREQGRRRLQQQQEKPQEERQQEQEQSSEARSCPHSPHLQEAESKGSNNDKEDMSGKCISSLMKGGKSCSAKDDSSVEIVKVPSAADADAASTGAQATATPGKLRVGKTRRKGKERRLVDSSESEEEGEGEDESSMEVLTEDVSDIEDPMDLLQQKSNRKRNRTHKVLRKRGKDGKSPSSTLPHSIQKHNHRAYHDSLDFSSCSDFEEVPCSQANQPRKRASSSSSASDKQAQVKHKRRRLADFLSSGSGSDNPLSGAEKELASEASGDSSKSEDKNTRFSPLLFCHPNTIKYAPLEAILSSGSNSDSEFETIRETPKNRKALKKIKKLQSSDGSSDNKMHSGGGSLSEAGSSDTAASERGRGKGGSTRTPPPRVSTGRTSRRKGRAGVVAAATVLASSSDSERGEFQAVRKRTQTSRPVLKTKRKLKYLLSSDEETSSEEGKKAARGSDGGNSSSASNENEEKSTPSQRRHNIRKLISDEKLAVSTKQAQLEERERIERLKKKSKSLAAESGSFVLEADPKTKKTVLEVRKSLVPHLMPHQKEGVKFVYDSCVESLERLEEKGGRGCVLAHCMGLGKTLQIIAILDSLLSSDNVKSPCCVLILSPINALFNWVKELDHWIPRMDRCYDVMVLANMDPSVKQRLQKLRWWYEKGGVMLMGYQLFRNLAQANRVKNASIKSSLEMFLLDPGPDIIVCDEGHILRSCKSSLSIMVNKVRTHCRIVLTGTPLQNNLNEYYTMVSFVKPNLLGTSREFSNRFVCPIKNGQCRDSTSQDVRLMKQRAHILYQLLEGTVQRRDYRVLKECLPPKHEYVVFIRLSPDQEALYQLRLGEKARSDLLSHDLFSAFSDLLKVWNHPLILKLDSEKREELDNGNDMADFIVSSSEEEEWNSEDNKSSKSSKSGASLSSRPLSGNGNGVDLIVIESDGEEGLPPPSSSSLPPGAGAGAGLKSKDSKGSSASNSSKTVTSGDGVTKGVSPAPSHSSPKEPWYRKVLRPGGEEDLALSGKMMFLFALLKEAGELGEKVLVFSQSLITLDVIEKFLSTPEHGNWVEGLDYFRLDGSTPADTRSWQMTEFNANSNERVRLFLISTKAGSLGVNLVAANRVVIFDACWNPCHDLQSIFRTYRFGQQKPVFVYRLLAKGTMEEKIYDRQVTKQSLSMRVIDQKQIGRHYTASDLSELFTYTSPPKGKPQEKPEADLLLCSMSDSLWEDWVVGYHEHDSLLEHIFDEELSEEERKQAWENYHAMNDAKTTAYNIRALQSRMTIGVDGGEQQFIIHHHHPTAVTVPGGVSTGPLALVPPAPLAVPTAPLAVVPNSQMMAPHMVQQQLPTGSESSNASTIKLALQTAIAQVNLMHRMQQMRAKGGSSSSSSSYPSPSPSSPSSSLGPANMHLHYRNMIDSVSKANNYLMKLHTGTIRLDKSSSVIIDELRKYLWRELQAVDQTLVQSYRPSPTTATTTARVLSTASTGVAQHKSGSGPGSLPYATSSNFHQPPRYHHHVLPQGSSSGATASVISHSNTASVISHGNTASVTAHGNAPSSVSSSSSSYGVVGSSSNNTSSPSVATSVLTSSNTSSFIPYSSVAAHGSPTASPLEIILETTKQ